MALEKQTMPRFKVSSGELVLIVTEINHRKAGDLAIKIHDQKKNSCKLGKLTLIQELNNLNKPSNEMFIATEHLIADNTGGVGEEDGQYTKLE